MEQMRQRDEQKPQGDLDELPKPQPLNHERGRVSGLTPAQPARLVLVVGVVVPLTLFAALAVAVERYGQLPGDIALQRLLTPIADLPLPRHAEHYFDESPTVGAALLAGLCLVLIVRRRVAEALFAVAAVGGLLAAEPFLKDAFERPPPNEGASGWSFPSGTAMVTMGCACWALLVVWPQIHRLRPLAVVLAAAFVVAYGLGIVYLDWHYPSDVVAGWCLAVSWVNALWLGATAFTRHTSRRRRVSPDAAPERFDGAGGF
jgi:membrane-associated phospholipid phosphatase